MIWICCILYLISMYYQHSATKFNRRYFGQILFDGLMVVAVAYKNWLGKYRIIA